LDAENIGKKILITIQDFLKYKNILVINLMKWLLSMNIDAIFILMIIFIPQKLKEMKFFLKTLKLRYLTVYKINL